MADGLDVKMNYGSMEAMRKSFQEAARQFQDTIVVLEKIEANLAEGALLGEAGDIFRHILRQRLIRRVHILQEKMDEMAEDIHGAVQYTRDGVETARRRFI